MTEEKHIDCLHYDDELGCCKVLSDWSQPMPMLQSCIESLCEHYVKGCYFCKQNDEKCGTCVKFFDYYEDGGSEHCSSPYDSEKCVAYKPMPFCSMCGRKLKDGAENG